MKETLETCSQRLRAAGEPTRARILWLLAAGELSVGELAQILGQSQPRLSQHLKLLAGAGLVDRMPEGSWVFYRLPAEGNARILLDQIHQMIDPADPAVMRDSVRLADVKAERAAAAEAYFAQVAADWDRLRALHYSEAEVEAAVLEAAGPGPFGQVIDFGSGTGRMLALLSPRARRVEGIDLNHHMLTVARSNLETWALSNASVRHGDVTSTPYADACADLVIIHQVLHFLDDPARAITEAARLLRPGGRLVVVDFAPHDLERLRREHAHRRLGVSDPDLTQWAERAGLLLAPVQRFDPPRGAPGLTVCVWAANRALGTQRGRAAA